MKLRRETRLNNMKNLNRIFEKVLKEGRNNTYTTTLDNGGTEREVIDNFEYDETDEIYEDICDFFQKTIVPKYKGKVTKEEAKEAILQSYDDIIYCEMY